MAKVDWALRTAAGKDVVRRDDATNNVSYIDVITSTDGRISLELHERSPGVLQIRAHDGCLVVLPEASNTVDIRDRTYLEAEMKTRSRKTTK